MRINHLLILFRICYHYCEDIHGRQAGLYQLPLSGYLIIIAGLPIILSYYVEYDMAQAAGRCALFGKQKKLYQGTSVVCQSNFCTNQNIFFILKQFRGANVTI
jgi:hypothetical protein